MAFNSVKILFASVLGVMPEQYDEVRKAWAVAVENGSAESFLAFLGRECGMAEDAFLQRLAAGLNWPYVELGKLVIDNEARAKISTKVAFQYNVLPTTLKEGTVQIAVSNPFDTAMLNAVRFDAHGPVQFALAPRVEIEKALKKYYGVGAETLDEMDEEMPLDLDLPLDKETIIIAD